MKYLFYISLLIFPLLPNVPQKIGIIEILFAFFIILAALGTIIKGLMKPRLVLLRNVTLFALGVFIIWLVINSFISFSNEVSMNSWMRAIAPMILLFLVAFIVTNEFKELDKIRELTLVFVLSSILFASKVMFGYILSPFLDIYNFYQSIKFEIITPQQIYQVFRLASIGLLFGIVWFSRGTKREKFYLYSLLFILLTILLTFSRGMILSGVIIIAGGTAFLYKKYGLPVGRNRLRFGLIDKFVIAILILSVLIGVLYYAELRQTGTNLFNSISNSIALLFSSEESQAIPVRLLEYKVFWSYYIQKPIAGYGLGYEIPYYFADGTLFKYVSYTHNLFTYSLLFTGFVGTLILIGLFLSVIKNLTKSMKTNSPEIQGISCGFLLAFLAVLLYLQFNPFFKNLSFNLFFGITIGISVNLERLSSVERIQ